MTLIDLVTQKLIMTLQTIENLTLKNVTLIIPTYNCFHHLEEHLEHIEPLLEYFGQIIAVDSFSKDGTYELLKTKLNHYNADVYQRPRGLYSSWNYAISNATCRYCYISTIGDLPNIQGLKSFIDTTIKSDADISISPPNIIKESSPGLCFNEWPIHKILSKFYIVNPIILEKELLNKINTYCALQDCYASLSGSFASNLSKTQILKNNPFPTKFEGIGDVVWWAQIAKKCRVLIYPYRVSNFMLHKKSYKSLSMTQNYNFVDEIIKTLKLNHHEMTSYRVQVNGVLKNKELLRKYKFFRLLMPVRYTNKFNLKKNSKIIEKIIEKLEIKLGIELINIKNSDFC